MDVRSVGLATDRVSLKMIGIGSEISSGESTRYTRNFTPEWLRRAALAAPG
eukprot:SAG31_NODE_17361_length_674_cov_0.678261_2_plen_51_part_00